MQTTNYSEQARSFLNRNASRMALRAIPLALMAVAVAHAGRAGSQASFSAPGTTSITGCTDGATGSLAGSPTNGGLGLTLSGSASYGSFGETACDLTMVWSGNGSGPFYGSTGTLNSDFTITATPGIFVTGWNLIVKINGTQRGAYSCTAPDERDLSRRLAPRITAAACTGPTTLTGQTFNLPATLSNWEGDLQVTAVYGDGGTLTVNVPGATSIDL